VANLGAFFWLLHTSGFTSDSRGVALTNVKTIEQAVEAPGPAELAEFRRWFVEFDAAAWDRQIEADAAAGKLDTFAAEAQADYSAGSTRDL
jgi:hypothetical protein